MSDTSAHENDTDAEGGSSQLREAARKGSHAVAENSDLKRQILFMKAGVDLDTKLGKMLYRTFEGDDLDALKAEALEIGLTGGTPAPSAADLAAEAARADEDARRGAAQQSLVGGRSGAPEAHEGPHPRDLALETYQVDVRAGMDIEEARQKAVASVLGAAVAGDKRVVFDHEAHLIAGREADRIASGRSS